MVRDFQQSAPHYSRGLFVACRKGRISGQPNPLFDPQRRPHKVVVRPNPLRWRRRSVAVGRLPDLDVVPFPGSRDHEAVVALVGDVRGGEVVQLPGLTPNPVQRLPVGVGVAGNDYGGAGLAGE